MIEKPPGRLIKYSIREATGEDYRHLCVVLREIDSLHQRSLPDVFLKYPKPVWPKKFVLDTLSDDDAELFIAESEGQVVGILRVVIRQSPDLPFLVPRRYAYIDTVVVMENIRRAGIGKALMQRAQRWAMDKKVQQVRLNVWEFNEEAIRFYKSLGYVCKTRQMWKSLDASLAKPEEHDEPGS
jgi:ribosomal protein S18 acetylase RimI-like enzyme